MRALFRVAFDDFCAREIDNVLSGVLERYQHHTNGRRQAKTPLNVLSRFPGPALTAIMGPTRNRTTTQWL